MYNKLFTKILDSSIWLESTPTRIVWLTFIAVMDESGFVQFAAVGNVANRARVSMDEAQHALDVLQQPDPESSDPEHEGRRIERVPGGWMVLNAEKHRALVTRCIQREQTRDRVRRHRLKRTGNASVTPSEAEAYTEAEAPKQQTAAKVVKTRPMFKGQRLTVFPWQEVELKRILGSHADAFDVFSWLQTADTLAAKLGVGRELWPWLQTELEREAGRRGLSVLPNPSLAGKQTTKLAHAIANIRREATK